MTTKLSPRQTQIAKMYCEGWTHSEMARELGIGIDTMRSSIRDIKRKWNNDDYDGAMSRRDFYSRAQQEGII